MARPEIGKLTVMVQRRRRLVTRALVVAGIVVLAVVAWIERGHLDSAGHAMARLRWQWVIPAVVAESGSMASLARGQLLLLRVSRREVTLRSGIAVTYAGNAMSVSLPLVGAGVGAAYSFRQWGRRGVDSAAVGWALTVSGVMSALSFALLMTVGAAVSGNGAAVAVGLTGAAISAVPALALLASVRSARVRRAVTGLAERAVDVSRRLFRHPQRDILAGLEELLDRAGSIRASRRRYVAVFGLALRNWVADCVCLAFAIKAAGAEIPWHGLLLAYCLAVTAGGSGLTPGGLGIVEATLTAALVASGLTAAHALTAVLVYRLISFWLVVAVGWLVAARLTRSERDTERDRAIQ